MSPPAERSTEPTPAANPARPSSGKAFGITVSSRGLRGIAKVLVAVGGIASAGGASYAAHALGDKTGAANVDALSKRLDKYEADEEREHAEFRADNRGLEQRLNATQVEVAGKLGGVEARLNDMSQSVSRMADELQALRLGQPVLTRYQPRRPPRDRQRVEHADDSNP